VRQGKVAELPVLYKMYAETAVRDGFVIRHEEYYLNTWRRFIEADMAKILIAEVENQPVAALILFHFNGTARYMFGMSTENDRELMPNYLLQWEAMRLAKRLGCHTYDMWGAPEVFDESDSLWGVFRSKKASTEPPPAPWVPGITPPDQRCTAATPKPCPNSSTCCASED